MGCPNPRLTEETADGKAVDSLLKHVRLIENSELRTALANFSTLAYILS